MAKSYSFLSSHLFTVSVNASLASTAPRRCCWCCLGLQWCGAGWSWAGQAGGQSSPLAAEQELRETQPGGWLMFCICSWLCAFHAPAAGAQLAGLRCVHLALLPFGPRFGGNCLERQGGSCVWFFVLFGRQKKKNPKKSCNINLSNQIYGHTWKENKVIFVLLVTESNCIVPVRYTPEIRWNRLF